MSTDAAFADVLAEVRKQAAAWPKPIEADYGFLAPVAKALGLDYEGVRNSEWERFCGQVHRALKKLAQEGALVRGDNPNRRGAVWRTPAQHEAWRRVRDERRAADQADAERVAAQRLRLAALGIVARIEFGSVALSADQLDTLMNLAAKGLD